MIVDELDKKKKVKN